MVLGVVALTSCDTDERSIEDSLSQELDQIKNHDDDIVSKLIAESGAEALSDYGISPDEFIDNYLDGFDFEIKGVETGDDEATARVVLICKSYAEFQKTFEKEALALADDKSLKNADESDINQKIGETALSVVSSLKPVDSDEIALTYERNNNTWAPVSDTEDALIKALFSV